MDKPQRFDSRNALSWTRSEPGPEALRRHRDPPRVLVAELDHRSRASCHRSGEAGVSPVRVSDGSAEPGTIRRGAGL